MLAKEERAQKKAKSVRKILCKAEVLLLRIERNHSYEETNSWI